LLLIVCLGETRHPDHDPDSLPSGRFQTEYAAAARPFPPRPTGSGGCGQPPGSLTNGLSLPAAKAGLASADTGGETGFIENFTLQVFGFTRPQHDSRRKGEGNTLVRVFR